MAITHVQSDATATTGAAGNTSSLTMSGATVSGNLLVVAVSSYGASQTVSSISDNKGNTFTRIGSVVRSPGDDTLDVFYAKNITGGASHQISVTMANTENIGITATEYSGVDLTTPINASNTAANGTGSTATSNSITPTVDGCQIWAAGTDQYLDYDSVSAGSGYSLLSMEGTANDSVRIYSEEKSQVTAAAATASFTLPDSVTWCAAIIAIKPASGGGGGGTPTPTSSMLLGVSGDGVGNAGSGSGGGGSTSAIYCIGDSNMAGYGSVTSTQTIPYYINQGVSSPNATTYNYALAGLPTSDTQAYLESTYNLSNVPSVGVRKIICFQGNTNDITNGDSVSTIVANLSALIAFYKSKGFTVIISTTLPRSDYAPFNTTTQSLNTQIRNNWASWGADALVDSYNLVSLGSDFQGDGVHLLPSGDSKVATGFVSAILTTGGGGGTPDYNLVPTANPGTGKTWNKTFFDNFPGSSLNSAKWSHLYPWGAVANGANGEDQWYDPAAVTVTGDNLIITATQATYNDYGETRHYRSGLIQTYNKFSQQYGYFEAKMKFEAGKGLWPAFWLLSNNASFPWPPEIDIVEWLGDELNDCHMTLHSNNAQGDYEQWGEPIHSASAFTNWHTFGIHWTNTKIDWYLDRIKVFTITNADMVIPSVPMYLIINQAVGGTWPGYPDGSVIFPKRTFVDWVNVWQAA